MNKIWVGRISKNSSTKAGGIKKPLSEKHTKIILAVLTCIDQDYPGSFPTMGGQSVSRMTQWLAIIALALDRKARSY